MADTVDILFEMIGDVIGEGAPVNAARAMAAITRAKERLAAITPAGGVEAEGVRNLIARLRKEGGETRLLYQDNRLGRELLMQAAEALEALAPSPKGQEAEGWKPTHRHVKRGTDYQVIGTALLQASEPIGEAAALVIYRGAKGDLWARPEGEFDDGRFEPVATSPTRDEEPAS